MVRLHRDRESQQDLLLAWLRVLRLLVELRRVRLLVSPWLRHVQALEMGRLPTVPGHRRLLGGPLRMTDR